MEWNGAQNQRGMHLHEQTSNLLSFGRDLSIRCRLKMFHSAFKM